MKIGLSLFLLCIYCLYFIRNPYFVLDKEQVKRSKSMLYTEIGIGCLVFILINIPYDGANLIHLLAVIGILSWVLELWLRILAVKSDSSLTLEKMPILLKKESLSWRQIVMLSITASSTKLAIVRLYGTVPIAVVKR